MEYIVKSKINIINTMIRLSKIRLYNEGLCWLYACAKYELKFTNSMAIEIPELYYNIWYKRLDKVREVTLVQYLKQKYNLSFDEAIAMVHEYRLSILYNIRFKLLKKINIK